MGCKTIDIAIVLLFFAKVSYCRLGLDPQDVRRPFDQELYKNVLDPIACRGQMGNISQGNPLLLLQFLDAGSRTPKGVLQQNRVDLGNYHQCLEIDETLDADMRVQGKYCVIQVPTEQNIQWPQFPGSWVDEKEYWMDEITQSNIGRAHADLYQARAVSGFEDIRSGPIGLPPMVFTLAVCVPKPCSTEEAISALIFNVSAVGFQFQEQYCRLPDDKPWVAADTVAVVAFSTIGFLTLLSTCYDLYHTLLLKRDPKSANAICTSFSVYTNTHNLLTFKTNKNALECLDGIRVLSMMWIIIGHSFMMYPFTSNSSDMHNWMWGVNALWITTAPIAVDTFLAIAGVLLVYTSIEKMNGWQLVSKLHLFYLHRFLRMFPALAALVLLEASVFHRVVDGPLWNNVARNTQRCRSFWWSTLLHVQNYVNPLSMCVAHSWYIAIDIQLYIVSPVVLFWVLSGNKRSAWTALVAGLLAILTGSTIFNFIMELPGGSLSVRRWGEINDFMMHYYYNTLTRGSPFFVGMIFGYLLHLCRGIKVKINLVLVLVMWTVALAAFAIPFYTTYLIKQFDWDNQTVDSLINSFQRSLWAVALGWMIFACVHGFGGPINWFLSLPMWKLPSRVSYAMYLYHFPIMFIYGDRLLTPNHFSVLSSVYDFICQLTIVLIVAIVVAVCIEAPFSILFKLMLDPRTVKPKTGIPFGAEQKKEVTS